MASSPYSFRSPKLPHAELAETVAPKQPPAADKPAPAVGEPAPTAREPLDKWGIELLQRLPGGVSLEKTATRYPHIVNRLALIWSDPRAVDRYLDGLLIDDRVDRQGFEFQALAELVNLRDVLQQMIRGRG